MRVLAWRVIRTAEAAVMMPAKPLHQPSAAPSSGIKRRDFLSQTGLALIAMPLMARAAFAQNAAAGPPSDTAIASLAVYPPLGIGRVGNSSEWFYAPEVPGLPALPNGDYKDGAQRIKKQVQRFRIYGFNAAGQAVREITAKEAKIEWTVHAANTKAAWYGFNNPLDNGERAPGLPGQKRNQQFLANDDRAKMLVIDAGPVTIAGAGINKTGDDRRYAMIGKFWNKLDVKLGHLQTDDDGRLLVFPGDGVSRSAVDNNPISNFSDNDGWQDDWCDGPVQAKVTFNDGSGMPAENAWVACCGPDFAPDIPPFVTLYDVLNDVNIEAQWTQAPKPPLSFRKYIYPFFYRLGLMNWLAAAQNLDQRWIDVGNFADPDYVARLANPSVNNLPFRHSVFEAFRDPHDDALQQYKLPYMLGDGINYAGSPLRWFRIPKAQYAILKAWADGDFVDDLGGNAPETVTAIEQLPISEQPEALTRAALDPCSGGAFHPGVELTWPLRHKELYGGPFRIALSIKRDPSLVQDLGQLLTPDKAFSGYNNVPPAVAPQMPGDLTRWMGLPWQCDAFSCQQVVFANDFPNATWWPALLPIDVLPQAFYEAVINDKLSAAERLKFFNSRVAWSRGVAGIGYHAEASYNDGLNQMIYLWHRMGFVVKRQLPDDPTRPPGIPPVAYVEVDRGSMDLQGDGKVFRGPPRR